tara:strand:+ start:2970 stop:3689 length:720 start_codon:yes stop_codon:yes gene_type:complete
MRCDFDNEKFFEFIDKLKKKHKNKNYKFKQSEYIKFLTIHLRDGSKLKKIIMKDRINLAEMKLLNSKCTGIVNLELSGSGILKKGELYFYINRDNTLLDLKDKVPNANADLSRTIVWHMHPWNISLDYARNVPSFFSYEDIRISVNFPGKIFVIFNMSCKDARLPVIYLVCAEKGLKKHKAKSVIADIYDDVYEKFMAKKYNVNFETIQKKLLKVGVHFHYIYKYDERCLIKWIERLCI